MLRRLGLGLTGRSNIGHQSEVHEQRALGSHLYTQLTYSLQEGLRFDVTYRAADLDECDVGITCTKNHATLYLIGDVWNDLNCSPEVVSSALALENLFIHLTGGEVVLLQHGSPAEALIVTQVEIGLCPIFGYIDLAMLEGTHGARIHIDIGIKF